MNPKEATEKVGMVVEGMFTAITTKELAMKVDVDMPITESINDVIDGKISAKEAVEYLMGKEKRHELD